MLSTYETIRFCGGAKSNLSIVRPSADRECRHETHVPFTILLHIHYNYRSSNRSDCDISDELRILTTYQAEDAGIHVDDHPQCEAFKLWKKTRETQVDLSSSDIDLLATRKDRITVTKQAEVTKYHLPEDILTNYTLVFIDFSEVCRLYPRVLRITSARAAARYRIDIPTLCSIPPVTENPFIGGTVDLLPARERRNAEISAEAEEKKDEETVISFNATSALPESATGMDVSLLTKHESISIFVEQICNNGSSTEEDNDLQYYQEKYGAFGFDVSSLGESVDSLVEIMRDTDRLDSILREFETMNSVERRPFPSTQILPWLKKVKYDSRSPPVLFQDDQVTVKVGLHIQSMSNFELSTMDYDVDAWLRMAWLDPRLRHGASRPILINEYNFLRKIWRPDPIFTNSKAATFHKVSYLNFYMYVFPGGEVFLDIRVYLKPTAAQIVLCKYPHDSPACSLKISSLGFTHDVVHFEWFSKDSDAILLNDDVQIPELIIVDYSPQRCDGTRKSGNYSCLEARFLMQREIGYHVAQTYIPTAICVVFAMINVWLPEEFVDGRIFVSLTVFLTLSAESNAAKEDLPKVSYIKAIDIWFGFTSTFVFFTMLQALVVISLEHSSKQLRKKCERYVDDLNAYQLAKMMLRSRRYHRLGRDIDAFFKVMYPVIFILFLTFYGFVITQGDEKKCLQPGQ